MATNEQTRSGGGIAAPLILAVLLWAALLACVWYLWQGLNSGYTVDKANYQQRIDSLREERDALRPLLELDPCAARAKTVGVLPQGAPEAARPGGSAPKVAAAAGPEDVEKACVFIVSADPGQKLSTGSGFFVAPGYVATNRHVVQNAKGKILVTSKALGKPALGRLVAKSEGEGNDFALLKVDVPPGADIAILNFAPDARKTEKVGAWGFPDLVGKNDPNYARLLEGGDLSSVPELSYTEGVVSAVLDRQPRVIVHTAPISPGNSGGPLVNAQGNVLGINTMITLDEDSYRQASIALAGKDLKNFLEEHDVRPGTGS